MNKYIIEFGQIHLGCALAEKCLEGKEGFSGIFSGTLQLAPWQRDGGMNVKMGKKHFPLQAMRLCPCTGGKCLNTKRSGRNILSSFDRLSEAFFHGENLLNKFLFFKSGNQDMELKFGFSNLGKCNVCGGKLLPIQIVIYHEPPAL